MKLKINNLSDNEFKAIGIRMPTELEKRIDEHSEKCNKEIENIKRTSLS